MPSLVHSVDKLNSTQAACREEPVNTGPRGTQAQLLMSLLYLLPHKLAAVGCHGCLHALPPQAKGLSGEAAKDNGSSRQTAAEAGEEGVPTGGYLCSEVGRGNREVWVRGLYHPDE